ncbi:type VI secretion system baseplate subunit TssF [Caballeronia sp. INDeC2]|uniref:type VI secretion system baseplate subunit TssF n=1 Tax=Caballeronia sp. INDeC2 TaxID=2921747 RepID=UPI00202890D0|nr:type VI secretion system baseplate subunit TssF [Caballeronia sp. INDeC2]
MNPDLLQYYSRELQHVREMGGEFAKAFPKIAGRLGLEGFDCADPYVERLLEGFGFLAARVQMKIDAEFPRFTQHLAELVYPHYLAPTPAMTVVQVQPDMTHPALAEGVAVPRGTALHGRLDGERSTRCEFRTAHALTLSPIELVEARLFTHSGALQGVQAPLPRGVKAALRMKLRAIGERKIRDIAFDHLPIHLRGNDGIAAKLYELLIGSTLGIATRDAVLPSWSLRPLGFSDDEALLPVSEQSFPGYRLLQEYFGCPQRFMFVGIDGLRAHFARCDSNEIELIVLLSKADVALEQLVDHANFALHCTPAINLFARRADRIAVTGEQFEHHVVVDRTRPRDFEVYRVQGVTGHRAGGGAEIAFEPFYRMRDLGADDADAAFYQVRREKRLPSAREEERGARSSYAGSETWIALVDTREAPYADDLHQLGISVLCTNRDLTITMPLGRGETDFTLELEAPVSSVRCVAPPSRPLPSHAQGAVAWRLLSHLSLNYASLVDDRDGSGARAMRDLLALYAPEGDSAAARQIEGLRSIRSRAVTRRLPSRGPIVFGRGLALDVLLDESGFEGASAFLFGAVLARFFEQYVSLNSFTETIVSSTRRGEIMRWAPGSGQCRTL